MHRLTVFSIDHPWMTGSLLLAVTVVLGFGVPQVRTEYGYRVLIGDDHPGIQRLDRLIDTFGGGLPERIVWACSEGQPCEHALDPSSLGMAHAVTEALRARDGIARVDGPANAALLVPEPGGFSVRRFYENGGTVDDREKLATIALEDPLWKGNLVSSDGKAASIVVQPTDTRPETDRAIVAAINDALALARSLGFEIHVVGEATAAHSSGVELSTSQSRLIPITVLGIGLVLALLLRPFMHVMLALASTGLALVWTFGLMGWLRWPQDGIAEVLPPMLLTIGVCDAVHLLCVHARWAQREGQSRSTWRNAAAEVSLACVLTTLTTAAAFLSFLASELETFSRFGVLSAFGVVSCLLTTFTVTPLLGSRMRIRGNERALSSSWHVGIESLMSTADRHHRLIVVSALVSTATFAAGWQWLRVDNDWMEAWGEGSSAVRAYRFSEHHLGPTDSLEVSLAAPPSVRFPANETHRVVQQISAELERQQGVESVTSVLTLLRRLNRLIHDDNPAFERLPNEAAANAQLLELVVLEDPSLRDRWITLDGTRFRISARFPISTARSATVVLEEIQARTRKYLPAGWQMELSGDVAMDSDWVTDVQQTQLRSFPIAFLLVTLLIGALLRSIRFAVIAMIPTLVPVIATVGILGWLGLSLDVGRAMLAAVILGIAVDDSVHLLVPFKRELSRTGDVRASIRYAMLSAGRSIITSSLALSIGFLSLMLSSWQSISSFGFLASIAILVALVADLVVLPAVVLWLWKESETDAARRCHVRTA